MINKRTIIPVAFFVGTLAIGSLWMVRDHYGKNSDKTATLRNLNDEALLALIKNDQNAFENFIKSGGDLQGKLPMIDGKTFTVAEGLSYFERANFIKYLQDQKISFLKQSTDGSDDMVTLALKKNNPEIFNLLMKENINLQARYGKNEMSLMHLASSHCSGKLMSMLNANGSLKWSDKAKDGTNSLTIASKSDCLSVLSFWKEQNVDFKKKDGRGESPLNLLRNKKDAAFAAFFQSFETTRKPASVASVEVNFYKKRKIPQDQMIDHSALIEPELRPDASVETAEYSEFSD